MNDYKGVLGLVVLVVAASGCAVLAGPDPVVTESGESQGLLETVQGTTTVSAEIRNEGAAGNVTATAVIENEEGTVISRESETFFMDANETRQIDIDVDVPSEAYQYRIEVEPAQ